MPLRFVEPAAQAYPFPLLVGQLLNSCLRTARGNEIVYRDRVRLSYAQFRDRVGRLASGLRALGAEEGSTVAVMDWDSNRYLECYFAVPMMGAVIQTVNVRLPPAQIAMTLARAEAEVLLVHREFLPLVEAALPKLPRVKAVVLIADGEDVPLPPWARVEYEGLLDAAAPDFPFRDFDENAVATTFFTTGTTGDPKQVSFTHRQLVLHTLANCGASGGTRGRSLGIDDVYMPLTPMFHVHAWGVPYIATMLGLKQVYPGRYDPATILDLHAREGVTYSHCVPTILHMVLAAAAARGDDLSGWMVSVGGAALTAALCQEGRRRGMHISAGYGMSETCPTVAHARTFVRDGLDDAGEVAELLLAGAPVPLVAARVLDAEGRELPADGRSQGELVLRAPWLTRCYTGDRAASDALWLGGWLHTQDVAVIRPDGSIDIRDRLKDVIKSGGEWLCSVTMEGVIADLDAVDEVAVVGVPDPHWGERPMAVVVPFAGRTVTPDDVNARLDRAIAAGDLSRYARVERVAVVEALPKTSVGKIDKKALRRTMAAGGGA